jgi:hypothetical protein
MKIQALALACLLVAGCGDDNEGQGDAGGDMSGAVTDGGDMAQATGDLAGTVCDPTPMTGDGTDCHTDFICPTGQICVQSGANFNCRFDCTPNVASTCACDRACTELFSPDGGFVGAGCVPAIAAGEACNGTTPCATSTLCAGQMGGQAYCLYDCNGQSDCPAHTQCMQITMGGNPIGLACVFLQNNNGKDLGQACTADANDVCKPGLLCDLNNASPTCKTQCNGPGDTASCTGGGTCTVITDTSKNKTVGFACK